MGKGKRFELNTKNAINEHTKPWVKAHRPDFSGSSKGEVADIMVLWQANRYDDQRPSGHPERHVAYGELKKRSGVEEGNRKVVMSGSSQDQNGVEELEELISESPPWTKRVVGIKFPNRELIVIEAESLLHHLRRDEEGWGPEYYDIDDVDFHGARLTRKNNISMRKPTLDTWPSSTAGHNDWAKLCFCIGLEPYDMEDN